MLEIHYLWEFECNLGTAIPKNARFMQGMVALPSQRRKQVGRHGKRNIISAQSAGSFYERSYVNTSLAC